MKTSLTKIWDKVFKNGPSNICGRQPFKNLKGYGLLSRPYHFKFFKGCLPQILLGPFLNTLSHMTLLKTDSKTDITTDLFREILDII